MDFFHEKTSNELYGLPLFSPPMSIFPRFPPGTRPPTLGVMNQTRLKEKFFHDNSSIHTKLNDFNQSYQKFASGLFEMAYPAFPPGHPLYSRLENTKTLQGENEKLRKENLELKKQLEKHQNSKSKTNF